MSGIGAENWETYGGNVANALPPWAEISFADIEVPPFDTTGAYWLHIRAFISSLARRVLPTPVTSIGVFIRTYFPALPTKVDDNLPIMLRDGSNNNLLTVRVTPSGVLQVYNGAGTPALLAQTSGPVIVAGSLQKIQAQFTMHATLGALEIRVDGNSVLTASGLVMPGTIAMLAFGNRNDFAVLTEYWIKDLAYYSLAGTYNSDWPAIAGVTTVYPAADTATAGFTPRPRQNVGAGVLYVPGSGSLLSGGSSATYNLGAADYTLEANVRFNAAVGANDFATLLGKWSASTSNRSYRLVKYGANTNAGHLRFEITTDGTLGTLVAVQDIVWEPEVGRWYNFAVVRSSGLNYLFIDGQLIAPPVADANTYFAATANFTVGGEQSGVGSTALANSSINGMVDQTRLTPGVARYVATYTPTTQPFPTSYPADPNYASVVLLLLYDENLLDSSSVGQTTTARGSAARNVPADAPPAYLTINPAAPIDDRFLEAALVSAAGVLTCTANPSNAQTVTLGATTYTFNTVLGAANSVLIGATLADSIANLVNAINKGPGEGTTYGTGTTQNASALASVGPTTGQATATAITPGTAGNAIVSTETLAAGSWTGATLSGGADIPGPSRFTLTPLDPTITGVRWIEARKRSFVDAGAAKLQLSFVVTGSAAAGADQSLTATPTNYLDVFEQDPHTSAALTPTSITNGSISFNRTT